MDKKKTRIRVIILISPILLLLLAGILFNCIRNVEIRKIEELSAWKRWQGENATPYTQISCFMTETDGFNIDSVGSFRVKALSKVIEAAEGDSSNEKMFTDAWSSSLHGNVSGEKGSAECKINAVGGNYFHFHSIRLLNGCYISDSDFAPDRILLDENLAWRLFGGNDLQGMQVYLNGLPFTVSGVFESSDPNAEPEAYVLYSTYCSAFEQIPITAYEFVFPQPVRNFAKNFAAENFPVKTAEMIESRQRYSHESLRSVIGRLKENVRHETGIVYPAWENDARSESVHLFVLQLFATVFYISAFLAAGSAAIHIFFRRKQKNRH